jgi:hypothetical protein
VEDLGRRWAREEVPVLINGVAEDRGDEGVEGGEVEFILAWWRQARLRRVMPATREGW